MGTEVLCRNKLGEERRQNIMCKWHVLRGSQSLPDLCQGPCGQESEGVRDGGNVVKQVRAGSFGLFQGAAIDPPTSVSYKPHFSVFTFGFMQTREMELLGYYLIIPSLIPFRKDKLQSYTSYPPGYSLQNASYAISIIFFF